MKISKISERLKEPKDEKGGGLLNLLGISAIVLVAALSIAGAATFGTILTHENLASKQAKNSADSGISEVVSRLSSGSCVESGSDSSLKYSYKVYHSAETTAPTTIDAAGLVFGCPSNSDRWVLIQSEGEGKNNTKKKSIATYEWIGTNVQMIPQVITGEQVSFTSSNVIGSALGLKVRPTIYSKNGGISCVASSGEKNVNINVDGAINPVDCSVTGNIKALADVDLGSAEIKGDVCSTAFISNSSNVAGETLENAPDCGVTGSMYGYKPNYTINTVNITADDCANFPKFKQVVESDYTVPTILNASLCGTEFTNMFSSSDNKVLDIGASELTIVVDEDTIIKNLTVMTSDGPSSLNFVIPSSDSNSTQSSCSSPASLNLENVIYKEGANGILYSPCSVSLKSSDISGQVYGGKNVNLENTKIHYYPIELVNTDTMVGDGNLQKHLVRVF